MSRTYLGNWSNAPNFNPAETKVKKPWCALLDQKDGCDGLVDKHTVNGFAFLVKTSGKTNWIGYILTPNLRKNKHKSRGAYEM
jgi:hypothetical protein